MGTRKIVGLAVSAVAALAIVGACSDTGADPVGTDMALPDVALHGTHAGPDVDHQVIGRWIAGLRQATVKYRDFDEAAPGGYDTPLLECMENPGVGGQGFHFGDMSLIEDDALLEFAPELLMYEPTKNGRMQLIGVEWIRPYEPGSERPSLNGVQFHHNETLGLWVLHAWIWKHNPAGMFENWNPTVSCRYAS